jgi:RNA polymerase sigma-70 factor (ECF subfamily)
MSKPHQSVTANTEAFEASRALLLGLAYRMTGQMSEAQDVVQDAWVRWQGVDSSQIDSAPAYLSRIVTRLCIDRAKSARAQREVYVGEWLPEPVHGDESFEPAAQAELAQDISMAMMLVLERCSPAERAALLLHDVLDQSFNEIAITLNRSVPACRKLASRARERVRENHQHQFVDPVTSKRFAQTFLNAIQAGDLEQMTELLAQDAVLTTDGGGKKSATLRPIFGREKIMRFFVGIVSKSGPPQSIALESINNQPGFLIVEPDGSLQTWSLNWSEAGQVTAIYLMRNPDKLAHFQSIAR